MRRFRAATVIVATVFAMLPFAQEAAPLHAQREGELERSAETLAHGKLEAALYVIRPTNDDRKPITLNADSLLKWQNTVDKSVHGNIFVWTKAGRPEVIASLYRFYSPKDQFDGEFQSLSLAPLVVKKNGETVWSPKEPGVALKMFEDAPEPPSSAPLRLITMRQLAEQFTGEMTDWSGESYRLRLMPKPLFRYESTDPQLLDGAIFSLTYTTDPEVLVLIEARKSDKGFRWMYGLARMNVGELKVSHRDREVWRADRLEHPFVYKDRVYTLFMDMPLPMPTNKAN